MTEQEFIEKWYEIFSDEWLEENMNDRNQIAKAEGISKEQSIGIWDAWNVIYEEQMKDYRPDSLPR